MPIEYWSILIAAATFAVIGASAVAALVQLRHLRASNELNSLLFVLADEPALADKFEFVRNGLPDKLEDAQFRHELAAAHVDRNAHPELVVAGWYEHIGTLLKHGLLSETTFLDVICPEVVMQDWRRLEPVVAIVRRDRGASRYMNFEYLTARCQALDAKHPEGIYPKRTPRLAVSDPWLAEDGVPAKPTFA